MVLYMCFDSRYLSDIVAIGLSIPDWAQEYWTKFLEIFQVWHVKIITWQSKTPVVDAAVANDVANYINNFPHKKSFPYKYPADFSRSNQDPAFCRYAV